MTVNAFEQAGFLQFLAAIDTALASRARMQGCRFSGGVLANFEISALKSTFVDLTKADGNVDKWGGGDIVIHDISDGVGEVVLR